MARLRYDKLLVIACALITACGDSTGRDDPEDARPAAADRATPDGDAHDGPTPEGDSPDGDTLDGAATAADGAHTVDFDRETTHTRPECRAAVAFHGVPTDASFEFGGERFRLGAEDRYEPSAGSISPYFLRDLDAAGDLAQGLARIGLTINRPLDGMTGPIGVQTSPAGAGGASNLIVTGAGSYLVRARAGRDPLFVRLGSAAGIDGTEEVRCTTMDLDLDHEFDIVCPHRGVVHVHYGTSSGDPTDPDAWTSFTLDSADGGATWADGTFSSLTRVVAPSHAYHVLFIASYGGPDAVVRYEPQGRTFVDVTPRHANLPGWWEDQVVPWDRTRIETFGYARLGDGLYARLADEAYPSSLFRLAWGEAGVSVALLDRDDFEGSGSSVLPSCNGLVYDQVLEGIYRGFLPSEVVDARIERSSGDPPTKFFGDGTSSGPGDADPMGAASFVLADGRIATVLTTIGELFTTLSFDDRGHLTPVGDVLGLLSPFTGVHGSTQHLTRDSDFVARRSNGAFLLTNGWGTSSVYDLDGDGSLELVIAAGIAEGPGGTEVGMYRELEPYGYRLSADDDGSLDRGTIAPIIYARANDGAFGPVPPSYHDLYPGNWLTVDFSAERGLLLGGFTGELAVYRSPAEVASVVFGAVAAGSVVRIYDDDGYDIRLPADPGFQHGTGEREHAVVGTVPGPVRIAVNDEDVGEIPSLPAGATVFIDWVHGDDGVESGAYSLTVIAD